MEVLEKQVVDLSEPPDVSSILPLPFEWCYITAGQVTLEDTSDRGGPKGGVFKVPAFYIAKYPITNTQFQVFVDAADGYRDLRWWNYSQEAITWRNEERQPKTPSSSATGNHPRVAVTWYEAVAFCQWLTSRIEKLRDAAQISLPTEQQWQRAAQGDDNRAYPWGNAFDSGKCNTWESNIKQSTPVGQYQVGASPFGVLDMSGNVWEWCLTIWGSHSTNLTGSDKRCIRGGSWDFEAINARAAFRHRKNPNLWSSSWGFRIAWLPNA